MIFIKPLASSKILNVLDTALCDVISDHLSLDFYPHDLSVLHQYVDKYELNALRLKCFEATNNINWDSLLRDACFSVLSSALGPDLLIQKKLNLSIHMPGDDLSTLAAHTDCSSGDSPFELVLWLPLTNAFDTNSMFICNRVESSRFYEAVLNGLRHNVDLSNSTYISINRGYFLVFPPTLIHGNSINSTDSTRISVNIRVKSVYSPYSKSLVGDRMFGSYYKEWNITEHHSWNYHVYNIFK
ncbi:sporadic carbohydrate cluster 2OG-Fe(II) oxygenase [Synechococcus sp. A15-24]|uniref:sporadic carbohydrate cluster 2OG-Fe(II) oxygenase n=1 Tax=Synechococcus sp. A15-24 TaxID=1050635 RepID=UPI001645EB11|nr:hypothetical protein SynA1524_00098 [Synechococcus sp. A15-24]